MKQCVVVLVTDGEPTVCNTDTAFLAQIAADALRDWNVLTFAIGMDGSNFNTGSYNCSGGGCSHDCDMFESHIGGVIVPQPSAMSIVPPICASTALHVDWQRRIRVGAWGLS